MKNLNFLLQHRFIKTALKNKSKTALIVDHTSYSYQHIYTDCLKLSLALKKKKIKRGDRVVIQTGSTYFTIIVYWAVLFCDAIACVLDPEFSGASFDNTINRLKPALIISDQNDDTFFANNNIDIQITQGFKNTEQDLAMIMHTSGSTGDPKGVMLSHRNVIAAVESITAYLTLTKKEVILSVLPLHFDYGLYQMLLAFSLGATLILEKNALFPQLIVDRIARYQVTVLPCVPQLIQVLHLCATQIPCDFSSVKTITNTGETLSVRHIEKLRFLFSKANIFSMYGLTECKRCSYVPPNQLSEKKDSIGIPIPNLEMWIENKNGQQQAPGVEGELVVAGPTVMQGYWMDQKATAEKIQIMHNGKRVLKTGDYAVMDQDGFFYFKGRSDAVVKFKGAKFNTQDYTKKLGLIENLNRCHVYFKETESHEKKLIVCAEVSDKKVSTDILRTRINSEFSSHQKPNDIFFIDHFPALSNGKIDKKRLELLG